MGLFLQTAIIQNCTSAYARSAIEKIEKMPHAYDLESKECKYKEQDSCTQILFNEHCSGYEQLTKILSKEVGQPVLLLYIYDDDYWGYYFYNNGEFLDAFNPMPHYFPNISSEEREMLSGNSTIIARYFRIDESAIQDYLVEWTTEKQENFEETAYEDDEFGQCESWQMTDFMKKLGYSYWDGTDFMESVQEQQESISIQSHAVPNSNSALNHDKPLPNALDRKYIDTMIADSQCYSNITKALSCGQYHVAFNECTKLIENSPDEANLYILRAYCNKLMRKNLEMERDLESALRHSPCDIMVLRARCPVIATTSRYRRHIEDLTKLMELDAENYNKYVLSRAWRYHWIGDDASARLDMKELLKRHGAQIEELDFSELYHALSMG